VALFELTNQTLVQVPETRFDSEVLKSTDLQRLLRQDISVLSGDLKVLAHDYGNWEDSNLRIDLLCLDKEANLVIVQIKSTADPGYLDLQAIRCAAMISALTFEEAVTAAARKSSRSGYSD
jgi:RecB family endonuclease NucS